MTTLLPVELYRVLLVEDNRGDAILLAEALREDPVFRLERADRLAGALEALATQRFDAVLLDLGLPDSQGFETVKSVVAVTRAPVIVLTGLDDESVGLAAIRLGAQDYLVKGRTNDEVVRRSLRFAIERARLRAAMASPLIETAPIGFAVFDRDLRYLYVNRAQTEMNGLPAVAHLGHRFDEVLPEAAAATAPLYQQVIETGQPLREMEVTSETPAAGGSVTWLINADPLFDAGGAVIGVTVSVVDITERKRKEAALAELAESRRQAQAIGESIPYGIWICDPDGGLRYASQSFLDLIGMTMDEAAGTGWMAALAPEAADKTAADWAATREAGGRWEYEHTVRGVDGRWYTLLSRGFPIRDESGQIVSWAGINLDITERKEAEAFRDAFIGVLSHELRTPVTSIFGASALLRRPGVDAVRAAELVADIGDETERLRRLIEDLLVLARAERGSLQVEGEPILLQHVVPRVVEEERHRWEGRRFDISIVDHIPVAWGDEPMVEQVLRNLLSNAAKYGPPDGQVEVVLDSSEGCPRVIVRDEGPGIDPEEADLLFQLFYRSPRTSRVAGSGIGLFVAQRLIEAMGGSIWAKPRDDGHGAEFGISLQPCPEEAP